MQTHGGGSATALWREGLERLQRALATDSGAPRAASELSAEPGARDPPTAAPGAGRPPEPSLEAGDRKEREPPELPGFRHFIHKPNLDQRFTLNGARFDPAHEESWARAERLMERLAALCLVPPLTHTNRNNPDLPSGYTYFLQLIAHDLVHSSILTSRQEGRLFGLTNLRDMPLRLETIYGGGPAQCPHVYQSDANARHRLRLGRIRRGGQAGAPARLDPGLVRDIARGTANTATDSGSDLHSVALIADPRNDSHAIISQMVVLFHLLHNTILKELDVGARAVTLTDAFAEIGRKFIAAHAACVLVYRAIIRGDLLPKILHRDVLEAYERGAVPILEAEEPWHEWRAPLELTHGFLRFAHAMIRPQYSLNPLTNFPTDPSGADGRAFKIAAVLDQSAERSASKMPFELKWLVEWQRFFGPNAVNLSVLIDPLGTHQLETAIKSADNSKILTERDLLSSIAVQPWSVGALVKELKQTHGNLLNRSPFLRRDRQAEGASGNRPPWHQPMSEWLASQNERVGNALTAAEIDHLAADPPIPFFVRFEAGLDPAIGGRHLGVLGSIVLADVIYGILQQDALFAIDSRADLSAQLESLSRHVFAGPGTRHSEVFGPLGKVKTFPDLLQYLGAQIEFPRV
jgi:hypothetical protein